MIEWIESLSLSASAGWLIAFVLHATVLLSAVWAIERLGLLKHPGWAEWAWRFALFGAFVSVSMELTPWDAMRAPSIDARPTAVSTPAPAAEATPVVDRDVAYGSKREDVAEVVAFDTRTAAATPTAGPAPVALPIASDALFLGLMLWLSGTVLLFVRVMCQALGLLRLRRRLVHAGVPAGVELQRTMQRLVQEMHVRAPTLRVLSGLTSPLVLPGAVLLPRWAEGLDARQQCAMLAHELAHLRRRDPLWRPLQRLALVPLFFHPLAWHAVRRLETLAETLCDAAAVERSGNGRHLAECLAECLARSADPYNTDHRGAGWALAMAERSGGIVDRVRTLLENSQMKFSTIPKRWRWTAAVCAILALIALPGVMVVSRPGVLPELLDHHRLADAVWQHALSITIRNNGDTMTIRSSAPAPGETLRATIDGDVAFNAEESDVARMGPGAVFEIEQRRGGVTRSLRMVPGKNGPVREYTVGGIARTFDAEAKAWLSTAIPDVYRVSGLQAEARAKRILARGGAAALLDEIGMLKHDFARAAYLGQFFAQAQPDQAQMTKAYALMRDIGSDFEKRRALDTALVRPRLEPEHQVALLSIAATIDSDFECAEWLIEAAGKLPVNDASAAEWSRVLRGLDSDFERRRALVAVIEDGTPRVGAAALALQSMQGMDSDFEQRSVLEAASRTGIALQDSDYLAVVEALASDFERREALVALIRSTTPDVARSQGILRSVRGMSSDFERSEVLKALASAMPHDVALIEDYRAVTRGMSDVERAQSEKALDRFYPG
ncbi:MAG: M56 family metallopeptidase [Lysobacter sp.]|nr:M56 family metallopeptidase [Lysobacter sp.]